MNEVQNPSVIGGIGLETLPLDGPEWIRQQGLLECLDGVCRISIRVSTKPVQEVEGILRRELEDFLQLRVALLLIGLQHHVHVAIQHVQGIDVQLHAIVQAKKHLGQQVEHLQNVFVPRAFGQRRRNLGEVTVEIGKHPGLARGQAKNRLRLL